MGNMNQLGVFGRIVPLTDAVCVPVGLLPRSWTLSTTPQLFSCLLFPHVVCGMILASAKSALAATGVCGWLPRMRPHGVIALLKTWHVNHVPFNEAAETPRIS